MAVFGDLFCFCSIAVQRVFSAHLPLRILGKRIRFTDFDVSGQIFLSNIRVYDMSCKVMERTILVLE